MFETLDMHYIRKLVHLNLRFKHVNRHPSRINVLTGLGGSGKTLILQALALCATEQRLIDPLVGMSFYTHGQGYLPARMEAGLKGGETLEWNYHDDDKPLAPFSILAYHGSMVSRRMIEADPSNLDRVQNLFGVGDPIGAAWWQFFVSNDEKKYSYLITSFYETINTLLGRFVPGLQMTGQRAPVNSTNYQTQFIYKNEWYWEREIPRGALFVFVLICDIVGWNFLAGITKVKNMEGVVLIDDVDLYLDEAQRMVFWDLLRESFPKIQFIMSVRHSSSLKGLRKNEGMFLHAGKVSYLSDLQDATLDRIQSLLRECEQCL